MTDYLQFYEKKPFEPKLSILGIPVDIGKDAMGTATAPEAFRQNGLISILESLGFSVTDLGDIDCPSNGHAILGDKKVKYLPSLLGVVREAAATVQKEIHNNRRMLILGGDHSLSIGTISGASVATGGDLGVIWIDAHGDMNTPETTLSGNIHGMPTATLMGHGHPDLVNLVTPGAKVAHENFLFIGLKDLDQAEVDFIRAKQLNTVTIMELAEKGLSPAFEKIIALTKRVTNVWVSLDIDSIDKEFAPATLMATPGGLTYREINNLARFIGSVGSVVGVDIVEQVVANDQHEKTMHLVFELVASFLGTEYSWYTDYMHKEAHKLESL